MSRYSKVNLEDLENRMGERAPGVDGRFARKAMESRDIGVSRFTYEPNLQSTFGHRHREQEEAYVVVAGSGRALLDGEVVELRQWDVLRVAPEVARAFAAGPDGLEVIAVGGPRPEGGDGMPAEAAWPDES